jgi:hypothetical protein
MAINEITLGCKLMTLCQVHELDSWLQDGELMQSVIKQHLLRAQLRMKQQADKHMSEISLNIGDQVMVVFETVQFVQVDYFLDGVVSERMNQVWVMH